jgi:hypothetical protein
MKLTNNNRNPGKLTREKKEDNKKQNRIIIPYSARNKRVNGPLEYSTLKPLISSDSPSLKSRGARLVSATTLNQRIEKRGRLMAPAIRRCSQENLGVLYPTITKTKTRAKETSYLTP